MTPEAGTGGSATAELLQKFGLKKYVRTKIEPDKEAMLLLDDGTLTKVNAARRQKEDFFVETKRELVNQELTKLSA